MVRSATTPPPVTDRFGTRSHGFNEPGHDEFVRGSVHDLASTQGYTGAYVNMPPIVVMSGMDMSYLPSPPLSRPVSVMARKTSSATSMLRCPLLVRCGGILSALRLALAKSSSLMMQ